MTKVFINPGHDPEIGWHDYYDQGAVNESLGLYENLIAADVGKLVEKYLMDAGCETYYLQDESLKRIYCRANEWGADLFLSIHCNAFNTLAKGTEVLTYPTDDEGAELGECILKQIVDSLGTFDRGIKYRTDVAVLNGTDMPAVLVEMAFIDNAEDAPLLRDKKDDFARAIARGVTDYLTGVGK